MLIGILIGVILLFIFPPVGIGVILLSIALGILNFLLEPFEQMKKKKDKKDSQKNMAKEIVKQQLIANGDKEGLARLQQEEEREKEESLLYKIEKWLDKWPSGR